MRGTTLVTGANGYTGNHLCRYLADRGVAVRAMYYAPDGVPDFRHPNIEAVPGDLTDRESLKRALEGIEVVHNVAALYRPTNIPNSLYFKVNADGIRNIVELAAEAGVKRFVQCSTVGVHGHIAQPPASETAPIKPDDYYQLSKLKGEEIARDLGKQLGLKMAIIRPAAIYGPGETRFLKLVQLLKRHRFVMFGTGEVTYHFCHIDDLCQAFMLCAEREEAVGETFIVADDHPVTLDQMAAIISQSLGVAPPRLHLPVWLLYGPALLCEWMCKPFHLSPPLHLRRVSWFTAVRAFDTSKARRLLGFQPKVLAEEGLPAMVRSFSEAGWLR